MRFVRSANERFWLRIERAVQVPPESLGVFRWIYGLFLLLFDTPHFAWIDRIPHAFFNPPVLSPAYLFSDFPRPPFFLIIDTILIVSLVMVTIGLQTRAMTLVLLLARLAGSSFQYSFGKIDNDIFAVVLLACMWFADWGAWYSADAAMGGAPTQPRSRRTVQALALLAVVLASGMLTAGLGKVHAWVDFNLHTSGFLAWFYPNYWALDRTELLAPYVPRVPLQLLEVADSIGPVLEVSGLLALLASRRLWVGWLAAIATFHLANALLLNIPFTAQAVSYLAFADLSSLLRHSNSRAFWLAASLAALASAWHVAARWTARGSTIVFVTSYESQVRAALYVAIPVCALVVAALSLQVIALHGRGSH